MGTFTKCESISPFLDARSRLLTQCSLLYSFRSCWWVHCWISRAHLRSPSPLSRPKLRRSHVSSRRRPNLRLNGIYHGTRSDFDRSLPLFPPRSRHGWSRRSRSLEEVGVQLSVPQWRTEEVGIHRVRSPGFTDCSNAHLCAGQDGSLQSTHAGEVQDYRRRRRLPCVSSPLLYPISRVLELTLH